MCRFTAIVGVVLSLAAAAPSSAKTRITDPVWADNDDLVVGCWAQNLGKKPRTVVATIVDGDMGDVIDSSSYEVAPGQVVEITGTFGPVFGAYCRFEHLSDKVRGSLNLREGNRTWLSLPATK